MSIPGNRPPRHFIMPDLEPGDVLLHHRTLKPMMRVTDYELVLTRTHNGQRLYFVLMEGEQILPEVKPS